MINLEKLEQEIRGIPRHEREATAQAVQEVSDKTDFFLESMPEFLFGRVHLALREGIKKHEKESDQSVLDLVQTMVLMAAMAALQDIKNDPARKAEFVKMAREGLKRDVGKLCRQLEGVDIHG